MDKIDAIKQSGLSPRVKAAGIVGALMGAPTDSIIRGMVAVQNEILSKEAEEKNPVNKMPADYTPTERKLHEMLTENTGISILDSGGEDNRSWQRNRKIKDFRREPAVSVTVYRDGQVTFSKSVFHYLRLRVEYTEASASLTDRMNEYGRENDVYGLELMEDFIEYITGYPAETFNTYNGESLLSQVLQGAEFTDNDVTYIALQIHNGCDVRGGYTEPVIFELMDEYLMGDTDLTASCGCRVVQTDDAGYHWYPLNGSISNGHAWPETWKGNPDTDTVTCTECNQAVEFDNY